MPLKLNAGKMIRQMHRCKDFLIAGPLVSVNGAIVARLNAATGDLCVIRNGQGTPTLAEVIGFREELCQLLPLTQSDSLDTGALVVSLGRPMNVPVGERMMGRIIDALGNPLDGLGPLRPTAWRPVASTPPNPLTRPPIQQPLHSGQRAIDSLLTLGVGQRVGLFAGSGVGKSTLLGEIAKRADTDANVVALVGERGREVRPFVEDCLGAQGLARSIVIVSTVDQSPLLRLRAAQTAITIADWLRERGGHVMFMMDSLTRFATAQRELAILLGEPPTSRGFPPSVFHRISTLVEQLGKNECGAISAILTVLVDGDDVTEPIADAARSVLDGHIVLDRRLAEKNHYPAINVSASISRAFHEITTPEHRAAAKAIRQVLASSEEVADMIRIGAYRPGSDARIDQALGLKPAIDQFLRQSIDEQAGFDETLAAMSEIATHWPTE